MSSNIPTRRVTRTTRTAALRDNENANARPSRLTSRAKPPSNAGAAAATTNNPGGVTRATAATAASRAKAGTGGDSKGDPAAQGKRKREALGEVTALVTNNRVKGSGVAAAKGLKGKGKEVINDEVTLKSKTTTTTVRQPLRTVMGPATRRTTRSTAVTTQQPLKVAKEEAVEVYDDNAMVIDDQPPAATTTRRVSTRRSTTQTVTSTRQSDINRRGPARSIAQKPVEDDPESTRAFKKRRPSSEAPEDDQQILEEERVQQELRDGIDELDVYADEEPEADPEGDQWVDLDAEDADDPLMVSEYVIEIFNYMKQVEITTMPNPNYMSKQKDLGWKMRGILNDWLIQIHVKFRLLPETLFLAINIIDRFLSARIVSLAKLQLVGVTCMFMAAKFEEIMAPSVRDFLHLADSSYNEAEILQAERYVLKTIDWNMNYSNPVHFLRRVSKADEYDMNVRTVAKYLLEIQCVEWRLIAAPPSLTAAASIWLARLVLGREQWTPNLAHYSSYSESSLIPTANLMLNYILKPVKHESFFKKYAGKRFFKSSVFLQEWALNRWSEGTQVALADELPALKAEIRITRERAIAAGEIIET